MAIARKRSNTDNSLSPIEELNPKVPGPDSRGHRSKPHRKFTTVISARVMGATVLLSLLRKIRPSRICTNQRNDALIYQDRDDKDDTMKVLRGM